VGVNSADALKRLHGTETNVNKVVMSNEEEKL
jgi:hypothetical protein